MAGVISSKWGKVQLGGRKHQLIHQEQARGSLVGAGGCYQGTERGR